MPYYGIICQEFGKMPKPEPYASDPVKCNKYN